MDNYSKEYIDGYTRCIKDILDDLKSEPNKFLGRKIKKYIATAKVIRQLEDLLIIKEQEFERQMEVE